MDQKRHSWRGPAFVGLCLLALLMCCATYGAIRQHVVPRTTVNHIYVRIQADDDWTVSPVIGGRSPAPSGDLTVDMVKTPG
jgi:hypothetical protein